MVGRNSIVKKFVIKNESNPREPFWVFVQANKNHGICEIVLSEKNKPVVRLQNALTKFQGNQYDSKITQEKLVNYLSEILNK